MAEFEIVGAGTVLSAQQPQRPLAEVDSEARIFEDQTAIEQGSGGHVPDGESGSTASGAIGIGAVN